MAAKKEEELAAAAPVAQPAKRSLRSASSQQKEAVSITEMIADAQKSSVRYDLRKRASPVRAESEPKSSQPASPPASSRSTSLCQSLGTRFASLRNWNGCRFLNTCFESGYLRFTLKQLFQILIASILLVVTLSIISHFNLFNSSELKGHFNTVTSRISTLFSTTYGGVTNLATKSIGFVRSIPNSVISLFTRK